jgi:hypothetical protein
MGREDRSMNENIIVWGIFGFIAIVLVLNFFKFIVDFFSNRKVYTQRAEVYSEVDKEIRPHLISLEKKFENDANAEGSFGSYVFGIFKEKFKGKDEKLVEKAVCKCCSDYEGADCKEDFCLDGSGVSCKATPRE